MHTAKERGKREKAKKKSKLRLEQHTANINDTTYKFNAKPISYELKRRLVFGLILYNIFFLVSDISLLCFFPLLSFSLRLASEYIGCVYMRRYVCKRTEYYGATAEREKKEKTTHNIFYCRKECICVVFCSLKCIVYHSFHIFFSSAAAASSSHGFSLFSPVFIVTAIAN